MHHYETSLKEYEVGGYQPTSTGCLVLPKLDISTELAYPASQRAHNSPTLTQRAFCVDLLKSLGL